MSRLSASVDTRWIDGIEYRGKLKEKADCVVRTLAVTLGMSYMAAHSWVKDYGRKDRRATCWNTLTGLLIELREQDMIEDVPARKYYKSTGKLRRMRLSTFAKEYPIGTYIISVSGHLLSLVDGEYIETDGKERLNERIVLKDQYVRSAWAVTKK